ncbi:inositol monophosphatase family protein [Spongiactinospora sp. TRM90649]|uniref:inositol monophosphatase family protein n=1 Tax=Spongiactinospora sp. TRM90649 TaxID=3031114 RepID=UPI0023F9352D|nr:inositol monophosphatase family protein [Spongiactinospora sp. TRM90649]MDF5757976.1 inositol monophosphatase family protein [Spongiactinospora sp. TRM90649]
MDQSASRELAGIAALAARSVGDRLREAFRSRPAVRTKRDFHDPVTEHDRAAEDIIRAVIAAECPDSVIVGEEGGVRRADGGEADAAEEGAVDGRVRWYVDPIDGTANFAAGVPFFCVSVAAAAGDEVVAGVVYDPMREEEFTAGPDGAFLGGRRLRSAGAASDREAMLLTSYPSSRDLAVEGEAALGRFGRLVTSFAAVRRPGSAALKLAHVAAGWSDVAFGMGASPWDVAAGSLLVRRAGGVYIPLGGSVFRVGGYLAHVGGFDLAGSALPEVARLRPAQISG